MKVGIFWYFKGRVIGTSVSPSNGVDTGNFVDSPVNHYDYWPHLQSSVASLKAHDYIDIPRGRALLRKRDKTLVIYMDGVLFQKAAKAKIKAFFGATNSRCIFKRDEHYTTDEAALATLFG